MNRRGFLKGLAGIGVFSILPGAGRIWRAERHLQWKSNATGIRAQLMECSLTRASIVNVSALDLGLMFDDIHKLRSQRPTATEIEVYTDRISAMYLKDMLAREKAMSWLLGV